MNKFSLIHVAKIFYLQHISLGLYIQLMRFQINVKWTAFKLLFSLEAWHWKREGFHQMTEELLPDPLRSVNRAVLGNAISGRRWWGLFEGLRLLICEGVVWKKKRGEVRKDASIKGDEELCSSVSILVFLIILSHKPTEAILILLTLISPVNVLLNIVRTKTFYVHNCIQGIEYSVSTNMLHNLIILKKKSSYCAADKKWGTSQKTYIVKIKTV